MIKLVIFVALISASICLNFFNEENLKQDLEQFITKNTSLVMLNKNQAKIETSNSTLQVLVPQTSNNIMSYFNALNLSQSQLNTLKTLLDGACWRDSFGRGVGEPVSDCTSDQEKDGALCYPKCDEGYKGVGPVCWETCRPGFEDRGIFCITDLHIYGKGCCCVLNQCCNSCPANYTDDGCTCRRPPKSYTKKSYGRGTGVALNCKENYELNGLLCYPMCQEDYVGNGPVCWFVILIYITDF